MSSVRSSSAGALIVSLGFGTGFWVLASFAGTMLDPAHAEPWTTSLIGALLASALIAPALLMAYHHARQRAAASHRAAGSHEVASHKGDLGDATPFVDETPSIDKTQSIAGEKPAPSHQSTLWPEPQRQETSPASEDPGWPHSPESAPQKRAA